MATEIKRKRGRPKVGARFTIQKHVFLDSAAAIKLARLSKKAGVSESSYIRSLIEVEK